MGHWLGVLPQRYAAIEIINHRLALRGPWLPMTDTLEIGAGLGAHIQYENLSRQRYTALELRSDLADRIRTAYPGVQVIVGDIQLRTAFADASFDRVLAIHVLEHLPDLPAALKEIRRVLRPQGRLMAVLPCEGGAAYTLARNISARRIFEKRYDMPYDWFVRSEHVNDAWEILQCLDEHFPVRRTTFWPMLVPSVQLNLVLGVECRPHK
jgi:SAM-dependent methyltransferase